MKDCNKDDESRLQSLLHKIQRVIDILRSESHFKFREDPMMMSTKYQVAFQEDALFQSFDTESNIMDGICIPLFQSIVSYYQQLDNEATTTTLNTTTTSEKKKPVAPKGLLSLKHYTDIGCLLELIMVCSLPKFYLPHRRVSSILQKRLPVMKFFQSSPLPTTTTTTITSSILELVKSFFLLKRFQPMFVPRHATDFVVLCLSTQNKKQQTKYKDILSIPLCIQVCRTLLAIPTIPSFMKRHCSMELQHYCETIHLKYVLASFLSTSDSSSAAMISRLTTVLPSTPSVLNQLLTLLSSSKDSELPIPMIIWSYLDQQTLKQQQCMLQTQLLPYLTIKIPELYTLLTYVIPTSTNIVHKLCHELLTTHSHLSFLLTKLVSISENNATLYSSEKEQVTWIIRHSLHHYYEEAIKFNHKQKQSKQEIKEEICQLVFKSFLSTATKNGKNTNEEMQPRIHLFIDSILVPSTNVKNEDESTINSIWKWLPKELFQSSFQNYLQQSSSSHSNDNSIIISMMILSQLCEKLPPSFLLYQDDDNDESSIFQLLTSAIQSHSPDESMISLMLSMLITILELGPSKRSSQREEDLLQKLIPHLQSYTTIETSTADLASMASHAMVLISSRSIPTPKNTIAAKKATTIWDQLKSIEMDLSSCHPPMRARGMVTMRYFAHAHLSTDTTTDKIQIVDDENGDIEMKCWQLTMKSLNDTESYVYLAGIQTIVTIVDCSNHKLKWLNKLFHAIFTSNTKYSNPQRLKLTDALHFIIRRRGTAIHTYIPTLLPYLFYHKPPPMKRVCDDSLNTEIWAQTHQYFQTSDDDESDNNLEEKQIRFSTGGPLFDVEEDELVRAACIHIVAELLSCTTTTLNVWIPHVSSLLHMCRNALVLDSLSSRPIARAASLCCRELYSTLYNQSETTDFFVQVVSCGEESLFHTLVQQQSTTNDAATKSRCEEAIEYRQLLHDSGILQSAQFLSESKNDNNNFVSNFLRSEFSSTNDNHPDQMTSTSILAQNHI